MAITYLIAGSNMGDRLWHLNHAYRMIQEAGSMVCSSVIYESSPWGFEGDMWFLNQVFKLESFVSARELLEIIHKCEIQLGRVRNHAGYESRTIDIDILIYGEEVIKTRDLVIPHPQMEYRKFVLVPMVEIASGLVHPVTKKTMNQLLIDCQDQGTVRKFN